MTAHPVRAGAGDDRPGTPEVVAEELRRRLGRAEARSRAEGHLVRGVLDSLEGRVGLLDADGVVLIANRQWRTDLAALDVPDGGLGADFFALTAGLGLAPDAVRQLHDAVRQTLAGQAHRAVKLDWAWAHGGEHVVVRLGTVSGHDRARAVVKIIDITEGQATQAELARITARLAAEKELLGAVLATIPHLVYWKDREGRYRGVNQAFLALRGAEAEDLVTGRREEDLAVRDELSGLLPGLEGEVLTTGRPAADHRVTLTGGPGGEPRELLLSVLPYGDADGDGGVIGVAADVTRLSRLERQVAQASRLESIGQLAAGIAHEINTPVQYVSDNTRFVAESVGRVLTGLRTARQGGPDLPAEVARLDLDFLEAEIPSALAQSQEGLDRVAEIVRAMKDFAHPGADRAGVDLNHAVESTVQVCRNEWKYVAEVHLDLAEGLDPVPAYEGELKQVLLNLLVNAAQAIAEHRERTDSAATGHITVSTRCEDGHAVVRVADDGPGMPESVRQRVFDPFFTTKDVGHGTGQGLSMAYATVVQKHGGTIEVDSAPGRGTTFTVTLPLVVATPAPA